MKKETDSQTPAAGKPPEMNITRPTNDTLRLRLAGNWRIGQLIPSFGEMEKQLKSDPQVQKITFDTSEITGWDSSLLTFLIDIAHLCTQAKIAIDNAGLPDGVPQLLTIAAAVPEKKDTGRDAARETFLTRVGENATEFFQSTADMLGFIGGAFVTFIRMFGGKTRFRGYDLALLIRQCGADALPIVTLISLLVGLILAFVGAIQLEMFGAQIYVANLVGIAMVRVLAAVMTGIIMAGRTGAAFAAQLGTMQVNEELDALEVLGISPMEFLVLPRMLALILMMPLLCLYADLMGVLGWPHCWCDDARYQCDGILQPDYISSSAQRSWDRDFQQHRVRCIGGADRLPAGYAVRAQRFSRGPGDDIGGGHRNRQHYRSNGHYNGVMQCSWTIK